MPDVDLTAVEIFQAVAHEKSISRAAVRLNRVQSNISTRLKQLEERLGVTLFLRERRGLVLTEEGETFLDYAERLLALSSEASEAVRDSRPSGTFRLGTMESTAAARLPDVLSRYHADFPEVDIHLETDTAGGLINRLNERSIDAAFIAEPVTIDGIRSQPVFEEQLILVAPASFPALRDRLDVSGRTIVAFEEGCAYRRYLQHWLRDENITPGSIMSVGSYLAILACVSAGTGYALVPKSVFDMIDSKGAFRQYRLPKAYRRIKTLLVWREDYRSAKLDALKDLLPRLAD